MDDQNVSDVEAATANDPTPASDETTVSQGTGGGAATSLGSNDGQLNPDPNPIVGAAPVTPVAPSDPSVPPFVNPDPDSAITEPPQLNPDGTVKEVIAPANQPSPVSPQVVAQEEAKKEAEEPPTIQELAACANALRVGQGDNGGHKVAALLDRVARKRIDNEQKTLDDSEETKTA